jgi:hypothetical protein
MVSSGGGDPPCISSGIASSVATGMGGAPRFRAGLRLSALARLAVGRRFAAGPRLELVRRFPVARRFEVARRFAVVRRFAVARRFTGRRFFRDEREVAARFLRFAIYCLLIRASTLIEKIFLQRGDCEPRGGTTTLLAGSSLCRLQAETLDAELKHAANGKGIVEVKPIAKPAAKPGKLSDPSKSLSNRTVTSEPSPMSRSVGKNIDAKHYVLH